MRIAVTIVDGVFGSGLATVTDILTAANFCSAEPDPLLDVTLLAPADEVRTGQGHRVLATVERYPLIGDHPAQTSFTRAAESIRVSERSRGSGGVRPAVASV